MTSKFNNHSPGYSAYTNLKRRQAIIATGLTKPEYFGLRQIEKKSFGARNISLVFTQTSLNLDTILPDPEVALTTAPNLTYTSGPTVTFPPLTGATNYKLFNNATNGLILDLGRNTEFSIPSLIISPTNLAPNTSYTVYTVASNSLGPSPNSNAITFTTPPAPPTIVVSGTNLTIPSSAGAVTYRLISSPAIVPTPTITAGNTSFTSLGLTPGTTYNLALTTTGSNGIESLQGNAVTFDTPPNPIQSVNYGTNTSSTAVVSWSSPSLGNVTGYNIYDGPTLYATVPGPTVNFGTLSGKPALASGTTFTNFSVKAYYNTPTNESTSVPLSFQTLGGAPSRPTLSLVSKTKTSVSLSWIPGSGIAPTGYILTQDGAPVSLSPVTSTSIVINTGISPGTAYNYSLIAYSGLTTNASPAAVLIVYTPPDNPRLLTSNITSTTATLSLSVLTGSVTGYDIYLGDASPSNLYASTTGSSIVLGTEPGKPTLTHDVYYTFNVIAYYNTTDNVSAVEPLVLTLPPPVSQFVFSDPPTNSRIAGLVAGPSYTGPFPVIPSTVTNIANSIFNRNLVSGTIRFPSSVTNIEPGAFVACPNLTNLIFVNGLNGVKIIGANAFEAVPISIPLVIPSSVTSIGPSAFRDSAWTSVTIPSPPPSIGDFAFNGCPGVTSISLPPDLKTLPYGVFRSCSGLTSVTFPDGLTSIGREAFQFCTSLTGNIVIPRSVTNIGDMAFDGCTNPGLFISYYSTTTITPPQYPGYGAFTRLVNPVTILP